MRSGTTSVADTLSARDKLHRHTSGIGIYNLESDELVPERSPRFDLIIALMTSIHRKRRLLMKRPWLHIKQNACPRRFVASTGTKVTIVFRDKEAIRNSWETKGRHLVGEADRARFEALRRVHLRQSLKLEREGLASTPWLPFLPKKD